MSEHMLDSNTGDFCEWLEKSWLSLDSSSSGEPLFPSLPGVKCVSMTLLSPSRSPMPRIRQSCNPVVFAQWIRMCLWQKMKEKSTGIKFQCNCLLNCGPQLLKFYPWFCVTTAVMNSVWLWFSHWRHAHFKLEKALEVQRWGRTADLVGPKGLTLNHAHTSTPRNEHVFQYFFISIL